MMRKIGLGGPLSVTEKKKKKKDWNRGLDDTINNSCTTSEPECVIYPPTDDVKRVKEGQANKQL